MNFHIRTATLPDAEAIAWHNRCMAQETEGRDLDPMVVGPGVQAVINDPSKGFYLVAEADGTVVANLMITVEWSDWRNCELWWFQSVFVRTEWRGQGIFKALFRQVEALAKARGVQELRLYVEHDNHTAQKTYQAMGMAESHYLMYEISLKEKE